MEWYNWLEDYNGQDNSLCRYEEAKKANDSKLANRILQKRKVSEKAMNAVRKAYEDNPCASDNELKVRSREIVHSSVLAIILSALIYSAIAKAIDYFIKRLRESNNSSCNCS